MKASNALRMLMPLGLVLAFAGAAGAQQAETTEPYRMLRSLQFVQDSVVLGDHSAGEMQRFMLSTIDQRLRTAEPSIFEDPRNVDAALVYAMSGGNPATLEYLVSRDVSGNFDNRVTDALRKYLSGKGMLVAKSIADMVPEYRGTKIGPYLALVAGNIMVGLDAAKALEFYDWARLGAPGTIVEEAALRRSMMLSMERKDIEKALGYSIAYIRRFLHSPYASQFADLFVKLVVDNVEHLPQDKVFDALSYMDQDRRREVYLRVARAAAIAGKNDLAKLAADNARALSAEGGAALADLYGGVAGVPTSGIDAAMQTITDIPDAALTPSDRALRDAARAVAAAVVQRPEALNPGPPAEEPKAGVPAADAQQDPRAPAGAGRAPAANPIQRPAPAAPSRQAQSPAAPQQAPGTPPGGAVQAANVDPGLKTFLDTGRSKLDEIDSLLNNGGASK